MAYSTLTITVNESVHWEFVLYSYLFMLITAITITRTWSTPRVKVEKNHTENVPPMLPYKIPCKI